MHRRLALNLVVSVLLAISMVSRALAEDTPMPADKTVANPADAPAETPAPAAPQAGDGDKYAEEAIKHYNRGVELHQAGFLNQAIAEYKAAIEADPRIEEVWSNLGGVYAAQRSYPKALEAFEKALALKPDRPTTLNGYATVLYARGKTAEAKEKWKQAVSLDPTFASAYYNMGNALEGERDITGALNAYYQAIVANPNLADAFYRLGGIYFKEKHLAQSKLLLKKSLELGPESDFARDATKEISAIDAQLGTDVADRQDLQTNVTAPKTRSTHTHQHEHESASAATPTPQQEKPRPVKEHRGLFTRHSKEKENRLDMFIQSADKAHAEQDLKEKPPE